MEKNVNIVQVVQNVFCGVYFGEYDCWGCKLAKSHQLHIGNYSWPSYVGRQPLWNRHLDGISVLLLCLLWVFFFDRDLCMTLYHLLLYFHNNFELTSVCVASYISSDANFFNVDVLPALSSPNITIFIPLYGFDFNSPNKSKRP